jgi:hypothetical protein
MTSDDHGCSQISTEIGITSTPVIDRKQGPNGTLFTVGMSKDSAGKYHQRIHALSITTGAEITGSPTEVEAAVPARLCTTYCDAWCCKSLILLGKFGEAAFMGGMATIRDKMAIWTTRVQFSILEANS